MKQQELKKILELHKKWLTEDGDEGRANLRCTDLRGADLRNADLQYADLRYADLRYACLQYADLQNADLRGANLKDADLQGAKNISEAVCVETNILPEGTLIGWKKVKKTIIKLEIPKEARRSNATGRKCRCEFAKVLEIQDMDGTLAEEQCVVNNNYIETTYEAGKMVYPDSWDDDRWNECSHGIHFFISREEAERY